MAPHLSTGFSNSWRSNNHHQGSDKGQLQESDSHPLFHLLNFSLNSFLSFSSFSRFSFSALSFSLRRPRTFVSASRPETSELSWKWSNKKIGSVGRLVNSNTAVRIPPPGNYNCIEKCSSHKIVEKRKRGLEWPVYKKNYQ